MTAGIVKALVLCALAQLAVAGPLGPIIHRPPVRTPTIKGASAVQNITSNFPWAIRRDGGGGGTIDGKHIINFADTTTDNTDALSDFGFLPFTSNSIAIADKAGTHVTDIGSSANAANTWVKQMWPFATRKNPIDGHSGENNDANHRYAIWPNTNIVYACQGSCGYTVSDVVHVTYRPYAEKFLYTTLAKITIGDNGPSVTREAVSLWNKNQINFGQYGLARARDGTGDILLFAAPDRAFGLKVARVNEKDIADTSKYRFWNGKKWQLNPPAEEDKASNIFQYSNGGYGVGTGDIFWNNHYGTWMAVFKGALVSDNAFKLMYSTTGHVTGPWSTEPIEAYNAVSCGDNDEHVHCNVGFNYGTHAYPDIDPTGQTLLLGWTYDGHQTMFATIEFE